MGKIFEDFAIGEAWVTYNHMRRYSILLVTREIQIHIVTHCQY